MKESSKVLVGVGLGIVAGSVAGYFLASAEGQEFQRKTKEQLNQLGHDVKKSLKENTEIATEKLNEASSTAKNWANDLSETVKEKISTTSEKLEDVKGNIQSGKAKAKKSIE